MPVAAASLGATELDGLALGRALRAGIYQLLSQQEHLNKINVFPVPDGDTGTNLALTVNAVLITLLRQPDAHAGTTLTRVADAALDGARGNSGAILAQFLLGVGDQLGQLARLTASDVAAAVAAGAAYARESMTEPRAGTILTVIADFANELDRLVTHERVTELGVLMRRAGEVAHRSLAHTREELESLRKANVVDAGGQGFVELIDGITQYLERGNDTEPEPPGRILIEDGAEITAGEEQDLTHRYCTECVISGREINRRRLRERLSAIGSSLVVAGTRSKAKVHVHVNDPTEVFRIAREYGELSGEKADDMQRQQHTAHLTGRRVAIVTDSAADIPEDVLERLDIHMVPVRVHFGEQSYLDKIGISPQEFFERLVTSPVHPKTSQPPPGDFRRYFEFLASHHPAVLSINLAARVSGTCNAARIAAERTQSHGEVTVVDSLNASVGQGLLVIDAAECAAAGCDARMVRERLASMIPRTRTFGLVGSLDYAVRGGRVPGSVKAFADFARVMPVLATRPDGRVGAGGFLLGRRALRDKFARFVLRRLAPDKRYRISVGHANAEADGAALLEYLRTHLPHVVASYLMPLGSALGVHGGPGMLVVAAQEYEPPPESGAA